MIQEEPETGNAGIEPLGTERGWNPGMSGGSGLAEKPSWCISFVTSGKVESVGTDAGRLVDLVMEGCGRSL